MITKDDMFAPLLAVYPSFQPAWQSFVAESEEHPEEEPLYYIALGLLAQHLVERLLAQDSSDFDAVFKIVESWHCAGDAYVREAATIGLLEGLQNHAGHRSMDPDLFVPWLLPESKKWWDKLNTFWGGDARALRED